MTLSRFSRAEAILSIAGCISGRRSGSWMTSVVRKSLSTFLRERRSSVRSSGCVLCSNSTRFHLIVCMRILHSYKIKLIFLDSGCRDFMFDICRYIDEVILGVIQRRFSKFYSSCALCYQEKFINLIMKMPIKKTSNR